VTLIIRAAEHPLNTFADLDFILPGSINAATDIPKTYLYVDNIHTGTEIIDYFVAKLKAYEEATPNVSLPSSLIRPFNANLSSEYRAAAMSSFRQGDIRILVCTDDQGCNIPDIDLVVQWKLPATLSHFIQRAGRAARGRGRTGLAVLIVERSAYNTNAPSAVVEKKMSKGRRRPNKRVNLVRDQGQSNAEAQDGTNRLDTIPRGTPLVDLEAADEGLSVLIRGTQCRRQVWA